MRMKENGAWGSGRERRKKGKREGYGRMKSRTETYIRMTKNEYESIKKTKNENLKENDNVCKDWKWKWEPELNCERKR